MIAWFKHRGLKMLFDNDDRRRLAAAQVEKIKRILARLDEATDIKHMALPAFGLHPLKGDLKGYWVVSVSGNWRIIFHFDDGNASDVDLVDYH